MNGFFSCSRNEITSLDYIPKKVKALYCAENKLTSLKNCPIIIEGPLICSSNNLKNLDGFGGFENLDVENSWFTYHIECSNNPIESLEDIQERNKKCNVNCRNCNSLPFNGDIITLSEIDEHYRQIKEEKEIKEITKKITKNIISLKPKI